MIKNLYSILFSIIFSIILGMFFYNHSHSHSHSHSETNICNKQLTDNEYITHMITHHEVAVSMSESHLNNTKNPIILDILRDVIRTQKYEIYLMKSSNMVNNTNVELNDEMSIKNIQMDKSYISTQGDFMKPNTPYISNTFCDPVFFNMSHNKDLHTMTDTMYIQHMIPHHQVAVDMSKKILQTSNNDFIIYLAYRIIRSQQSEITKLYYLKTSENMFESTIL